MGSCTPKLTPPEYRHIRKVCHCDDVPTPTNNATSAENAGRIHLMYGSTAARYLSMTSCSGVNTRNGGVSRLTISRLTYISTKNRTPNTSPSSNLDQKMVQKTFVKWTSRNHRRST